MTIKNVKAIILFSPIIFGCQLNKNDYLIQKNEIEQITALTSGIHYLKEICEIEKLPDEAKIISVAMKMMNQDKKYNSQIHNEIISKETEIRYAKIKYDNIDNNYKCGELKSILNSFIAKVMQ
jgi:general secretion pathway protein S